MYLSAKRYKKVPEPGMETYTLILALREADSLSKKQLTVWELLERT